MQKRYMVIKGISHVNLVTNIASLAKIIPKIKTYFVKKFDMFLFLYFVRLKLSNCGKIINIASFLPSDRKTPPNTHLQFFNTESCIF